MKRDVDDSPSRALLRPRVFFGVLALGTIALGLGVHWRGDVLGSVPRDMLGDGIWAAMIVWCVAALAPSAPVRDRTLVALGICFAVELSQLYHTPALDAARRTSIGELTLGSGFDPRDLLSYALGVLAAVLFDQAVRRRLRRAPQ